MVARPHVFVQPPASVPARHYQELILSTALIKLGVITEGSLKRREHYNEPKEMATALQDLLICLEMFVAAVLHNQVFSYVEFSPDGEPTPGMTWKRALHEIFSVTDAVTQNPMAVTKLSKLTSCDFGSSGSGRPCSSCN